MSDLPPAAPPGAPPDWGLPPPPPPPPPPSDPPPYEPAAAYPPAAQPPAYWTPQPAPAPIPQRRSTRNLVVILSAVVALLLVVVLVGGYVLVGNNYASSRISAAELALSAAHHFDFDASLREITGGFAATSVSFDPFGFQRSVRSFTDGIKTNDTEIATDVGALQSAQGRLGDMSWLTALNHSSLTSESNRIDHAVKALGAARRITDDFNRDGQFFQSYSAGWVDYANYVNAAGSSSATVAISSLEQMKTDIAKALTLASSPGLPASVREYVTDLQKVVADSLAVINASLAGDQTAFDAAQAQLKTDAATINAFDSSSIDSAIQSYYQPTISTYKQELQLASS